MDFLHLHGVIPHGEGFSSFQLSRIMRLHGQSFIEFCEEILNDGMCDMLNASDMKIPLNFQHLRGLISHVSRGVRDRERYS